ncbi:MAG TPA: DUF3465 domain-containing protein [Candidatus Baltobacteraceae bacterium]
MDFAANYRATAPGMVDFSAKVASAPHYFYGSNSHAMHEAFDVATAAGPVEIVDNVSIAPRVPVQVGDRIEIRGEMVHDPGRSPIVHWTHHDPQHTHPDGFIRYRGRVYA